MRFSGIEVITIGIENHAEMEQHDLNDTNHDYNENTNKKKKKKNSFTFPHWVLYPTWILCILVMLGCAFMVIWYGISFGNKKSVEWLKSVTIALVSSYVQFINNDQVIKVKYCCRSNRVE